MKKEPKFYLFIFIYIEVCFLFKTLCIIKIEIITHTNIKYVNSHSLSSFSLFFFGNSVYVNTVHSFLKTYYAERESSTKNLIKFSILLTFRRFRLIYVFLFHRKHWTIFAKPLFSWVTQFCAYSAPFFGSFWVCGLCLSMFVRLFMCE